MALFPAVFGLCCLALILDLHFHWANLSDFLHEKCLNLSHYEGHHLSLVQALLCGEPLRDPNFLDAFRKLGLLHIFVVSGAHLLFIESKLFRYFPKTLVLVLLFLYSATCQHSAPVLRAFLFWSAQGFSMNHKLNWPHHQSSATATLACVFLVPKGLDSLSLVLSAAASVILGLSSGQGLRQNAKFYFLFSPYLLKLGIPHPLAILTTTLASPLVFHVLLPLSALAVLGPSLSPFIEGGWSIFMDLARWAATYGDMGTPLSIPISSLWIYYLLLVTLGEWLWKKSLSHS